MSAELSSLTPLANNLWQSTIFVGVICLITVAFKKNRAAVRYWLWFAASVKFLLPFSFLVALGSRLSWRSGAPVAQPQWSFVVDNAIQPFAASTAPPQVVSPHASFTFTSILVAVWLCGATVGLVFWLKCWMQMRRIRKTATPLPLGLPIPALSSSSQIEPGVFGVFRPVLLLPEGIESRLTPAQLEAIVAHEMAHVRRRDNLTAAIHMLVEVVFWFFPVVYWLRACLIEERENACDEVVLRMGSEAESYAEGIIQVCKSYAESPADCMSGISGSDLKKRVLRIVNRHLGENLTCGKKVALALASAVLVVAPLVLDVLNAPLLDAQSASSDKPRVATTVGPKFEIASIKPNHNADMRAGIGLPAGRFTATNLTARILIAWAYSGDHHGMNMLSDDQIAGGPNWINSERFDIDAKVGDSFIQDEKNLPTDQWTNKVRLMLQSLLAERFNLKVSHQTKELPMYALVVAKSGSKLVKSAVSPPGPVAAPRPAQGQPKPLLSIRPGQITAVGMSVDALAQALERQSELGGREVLDHTGLPARTYDFTLRWTPELVTSAPGVPDGNPVPVAPLTDSSGPSLFTALEEQLGLRLESTKGPVDVLVIDHIEKPTPN
jgi:bla regulator protein BlaR1